MPTRTVNLPEHFDTLIETGIRSGRFSDANEVVGEALRLLQEREAEDHVKRTWLHSAAQESFAALDRGEGIAFHSIDHLAEFIETTGEDLEAEHRHG